MLWARGCALRTTSSVATATSAHTVLQGTGGGGGGVPLFVRVSFSPKITDYSQWYIELELMRLLYNSSLEGAPKLKFAPFCSS